MTKITLLVLLIIAALIIYAIIAGIVLFIVGRIYSDNDFAITVAIIWPIGLPILLLILLTGYIDELLERLFK